MMHDSESILSPKQRRHRNHQEMGDAILSIARNIMREEGVAALSLQEIARRLGMRAPSLYTYFPSKNAIYEALFERGMREYRQQVEASIAQSADLWDGIRQAIELHFKFAFENPDLFQLLFERPMPEFIPSQAGLEEGRKLIEVSREALIRLIRDSNANIPASAEVVHNLLIALMHGLVTQHMANEPHLPLGEGRFGSLIPLMMELLQQAWGANQNPQTKSSRSEE
jgi:AcrR family transcriptional regulator